MTEKDIEELRTAFYKDTRAKFEEWYAEITSGTPEQKSRETMSKQLLWTGWKACKDCYDPGEVE